MADHIADFNESEFLSEFGEVPNMPVSSMFEGASQLAGNDDSPYGTHGGQASSFGLDDVQPEALPAPLDGGAPQPAAGDFADPQNFGANFTPEMVESYPSMLTTKQMEETQVQRQDSGNEVAELTPNQDRAAKMGKALQSVSQFTD